MTTDRQRLIADALGRTPRTIVEIDDGYDFKVAIVDDEWVFRFPRRPGVEEVATPRLPPEAPAGVGCNVMAAPEATDRAAEEGVSPPPPCRHRRT